MTSVRYLLAAALIAACATGAAAQGNQDLSQVQIKPTKVTDKFYTLEGQGGMIGVLVRARRRIHGRHAVRTVERQDRRGHQAADAAAD